MGRKRFWKGKYLFLYIAGCLSILCHGGCVHIPQNNKEEKPLTHLLKKGDAAILRGDFITALSENHRLMKRFEATLGDQLLYQMGIIYAHPMNSKRNYPKAMDAFRQILNRYPKSERWQEASAWMGVLSDAIYKENEIIYLNDKVKLIQSTLQSQRQKIESLSELNRILRSQRHRQEEPQQTPEVVPQEKQIEALQNEVRELQDLIERMKQIDIQIEEEKRKVVPK